MGGHPCQPLGRLLPWLALDEAAQAVGGVPGNGTAVGHARIEHQAERTLVNAGIAVVVAFGDVGFCPRRPRLAALGA